MAQDLLIKNIRPMGGPTADVLIRNGLIDQTGPNLTPPQEAIETIDGEGCLLIPGLVDGHMHLDKTFLGLPWIPHQSGPTTFERIEAEKVMRSTIPRSVEEQAGKLIRLAISKGSTHIRTHVDIDPDLGLSHLEAVMAARDTFKDVVSIQIVAFPQSGVMRCPGTADLLEEAVKAGADVVGGIDPTGLDQDADGQLDTIFGIAGRHGVGVDIHLHDRGEPGVHQIGLIAEHTRANGLAGKVAISHAYCLGMVDDGRVGHMAGQLAESGISIMTTGAPHSPVPPVQRLHDEGVTVFCGSDGVRDAWTPFGNADMLERAMIVALRFNFRTDDGLGLAFNMATKGGALALGLDGYGLEMGCAGDVVLLEGENVFEAVVNRSTRKMVVKAGRIVAQDGGALV